MNKSNICFWLASTVLTLTILAMIILSAFHYGRLFELNNVRTNLLKVKAGAYINIKGTDVAIDAFGNARDLRSLNFKTNSSSSKGR